MVEILKQYLPLCWYEHQPLELTRSSSFFKKNLLFYFVIEYFMQANMTDDPFESFTEVSVQIILALIFIGLLLRLNKSLYAYLQVTTAILVTSNAIALFVVPVLIWLTVDEDILSYYCLGLLFLWELTVIGYIFKRSLQVNTAASVVVAFLYFIITYLGAFALGQM
ncbi:MAG: hypothetical protein NTY69_05410 [Methylococcales bacterium]|nr:hypothetical protein [Methylococcales bacterium]